MTNFFAEIGVGVVIVLLLPWFVRYIMWVLGIHND